ncbi:MAG: hypothetical protein KJ666_00830 [Bacteroidetes bacterium]|nr:hypothetical protein [Bacteroidota bacterium]MBU2585730.1 hypothetical protein [Bacteroidota bacterium]
MVRRSSRISIERSRSNDFIKVAENFYRGAEVAFEYEYYNAAGVLIIHSAIAYADVITIKHGGVKSRGDNHYEVILLIEEIMESTDKRNKAMNNFRKIIDVKNEISYSGDVYMRKDIDKLWKLFERFKNWVDDLV